MEESDSLLVSQIKNNNEKAFDALFRKYYANLSLYATRFTNDLEQSEELVQDVFVAFWEKRHALDIKVSVKSYLYRSTHNACMHFFRQKKNQEKYIGYILHSRQNEEYSADILEQVELEEKIYNIIEQLSPQCKKIFLMSRFEELKYREIAEKLDLSIKSVEAQISKALKILAKNLSDYLPLLIFVSLFMEYLFKFI